MAITVGTNTYITIADADTYFSNLGNTTWDGKTDAQKEVALRLACQYIENKYSGRWKGAVTDLDQALSWPRSGVTDREGRSIDTDEYPSGLTDAQCDLAYKSFTETLMPDIDAGASQMIEQKAGPVTQKWSPGKNPKKRFELAHSLLKPYLVTSGVRLVRC